MKKQLAEVVDVTEIKEITEQEILYSCENNWAKDLCSTKITPHVEAIVKLERR